MIITNNAWKKYIKVLRAIDDKAAAEMTKYVNQLRDRGIRGDEGAQMIVDYAYALATKYGEASAAMACEMYDALALLQGAMVPAAVPAQTATYGEVAKAVRGTMLQSTNEEVIAGAVSRVVKLVGVDTMQQNALRDGAEWAWIPSGDTCAFCLTLASNGWQRASKDAIKNGHAKHVHANCDCTYAIRFSPNVDVEGYDPDKYLSMYENADGGTPDEKINALRRQFYAKNKDKINAQKRSAYEKRMERNSSAAEEIDID